MQQRALITEELIKLLEDEHLYSLVEKAIKKASEINPDPITNPVKSIEDLYDFMDWSSICMPWNVLNKANYSSLYESIDQSLNYFWFIFGQQLDELKNKDYYLPTLEYHEPIASWIKEYANEWGKFLSSEDSWNDEYFKKQFEDDRFGMNENWYSKENIWKTYNDFFSRHLISPSVRPIGNAQMVSPADCRIEGVWKIKEDGYIDDGVKIKSHNFYSVDDIIGPSSKYHGFFNGGTLTHAFLNVNDYHRYHFPIDGRIIEMNKIDAFNAVGGRTYYDSNKKCYICDSSDTSWQARETRDCIILETHFGKVAVLPVGMSQICSCNFEENLKVGDEVKKGDPLGYFLFGGSDIVVIFEKNVELKLIGKINEHILMGENYAELKLK